MGSARTLVDYFFAFNPADDLDAKFVPAHYSVRMIDHVTMQVDDVQRSRAFYEGVLAPLGIAALAVDGDAVGFFGPRSGGFWLCPGGGTETRELHVAFTATSRSQVREFHCAAVNLGAEVLHGPQVFDQYGPDYFAAFVRDPDGHNIEVVCRLTGE